jgi:hypothetical protein
MWNIEANIDSGDLSFTRNSGAGVGTGRLPVRFDTNRANGGSVTFSTEINANEAAIMVFDGSHASKWLTASGNATGWVAYDFAADDAYAIDSYAITSANDSPGRDPKTWTLEGSNDDGATWTVVDTQTDVAYDDARFATKNYTVADPGSYKVYKLDVTANHGDSGLMGFAELRLYSGESDDAAWTHIATTFDGTVAKFYRNGVEVGSNDTWTLGPDFEAALRIGCGEGWTDHTGGGNFANVVVDGVVLSNYAKTDLEVAQVVANDTGLPVCPVSTVATYDFDGDCVVGVSDLAVVLSQWASCEWQSCID